MRLRVKPVRDALHPSEIVVSVETADGKAEQMVVHRRTVSENSLEIGYPISEQSHSYLVELPRETTTGAWRVWVPSSLVSA